MGPPLPAEHVESARRRVEDFRRLRDAGLVARHGDFFPSVHYPPITMYPPARPEGILASYEPPPDGRFDVYVHVPFCPSRCLYCHYPSRYGFDPAEQDRYLDALEGEMDLLLARLGLPGIAPRSILVGGGTPTFLSPGRLGRLLRTLAGRLDGSRPTQFNFDVDPSTLLGTEGGERLALLREHGVDRLSIGIQSLDDGVLRLMNRPHTAGEAEEAVGRAMEAGFRVNGELIFGHPGQTPEGWCADVERAAALGTDEIQLYRLKVEPYGDLEGLVRAFRERNPGLVPAPEEAIGMKAMAASILSAAGFRENLRRVFSRRREDYSHYAHNQCCELLDGIGFGPSAFSSLRDRFSLNTPDFGGYCRRIGEGGLPMDRGLVRSREEQVRWALVLPLKNRSVRGETFRRATGVPLGDVFPRKVATLEEHGLLRRDAGGMALTELGGFFADEVAHQFHHPDHVPFPRGDYEEGPLNPYRDPEVFSRGEGS